MAGVAHTVARHAQSVSAALRIDTLGGRNVAFGALPAAVALTAPPGVLAITTAQDRTGSWGKTTINLQVLKCKNMISGDRCDIPF